MGGQYEGWASHQVLWERRNAEPSAPFATNETIAYRRMDIVFRLREVSEINLRDIVYLRAISLEHSRADIGTIRDFEAEHICYKDLEALVNQGICSKKPSPSRDLYTANPIERWPLAHRQAYISWQELKNK